MAIAFQLLVLTIVIVCACWAIVGDLRRAAETSEIESAPRRKPWIHFGMLILSGPMLLASSQVALEGLGWTTSAESAFSVLGGLLVIAGSFVFLFGIFDKHVFHPGRPAIPVRRIRSVLRGFVVGFILLPTAGVMWLFVMNRPASDSDVSAVATSTQRFSDQAGRFSVAAPGGWEENPHFLQQGVAIGLSDITRDLHVSVAVASKADLVPASLRDHANVWLEHFDQFLSDVQITPWDAVYIDDQLALTCEVQCISDNVRLTFLLVCVETSSHVYSIRAWSTRSQFEENRQVLESIVRSFSEAG